MLAEGINLLGHSLLLAIELSCQICLETGVEGSELEASEAVSVVLTEVLERGRMVALERDLISFVDHVF